MTRAEAVGEVSEVFIPRGKKNGKLQAFVFVSMSTPEEAQVAIANLHDTTTDIFVRGLSLALDLTSPSRQSAPTRYTHA